MANIYDLLEQINSAIYGKDVRGSIHDAIEQCYKDATGNPDSLSAILEKLFNGSIAGIGDVVDGNTEWGTEVSDITPNTTTQLNSVNLHAGTWLLFYNVLFTSAANDSANPYEVWCTISPGISPSGIPINYSTSLNTDPSDLGTSYSGFFVATVTEDEAYNLYTRHSGLLAASAKSELIAIRIKSDSDDEDPGLVNQVAQNTADISLLNNASLELDDDGRLKISGLSSNTPEVNDRIEIVEQGLSTEISTRSSADSDLSNQIAVERSRISNLASLEEGSTTGDAELIDIRTGADGNIYESAGDAVRGQINDVKADFNELNDTYSTGEYMYLGTVENSYLNTQTHAPQNYAGWDRTDYVPTLGAKSLTIEYSGSTASGYCGFFDAQKEWIKSFTLLPLGVNYIIPPSNAAYLMLSCAHDDYSTLKIKRPYTESIERQLYPYVYIMRPYIPEDSVISSTFPVIANNGDVVTLELIGAEGVVSGNVFFIYYNDEGSGRIRFDSSDKVSFVLNDSINTIGFYVGAQQAVGSGYIQAKYTFFNSAICKNTIEYIDDPSLYDDGQTNVTIKFNKLIYSHGAWSGEYQYLSEDFTNWAYDYDFSKDVYKTNIVNDPMQTLILDTSTGHMRLVYNQEDITANMIIMIARDSYGALYGAYVDQWRKHVFDSKSVFKDYYALNAEMITAIDSKENTFIGELSPSVFAFVLTTDDHNGGAIDKRVRYTALGIQKVLKDLPLDGVVNCGDVVLSDAGTTEDALKHYFEIIPNDNMIYCQGNHDRSSKLPMLPQRDFFNLVYRKQYGDSSFHFGKYPATYFYKDYSDKKIRVVVLDMYDSDVITNDRLQNAGYKNDQLNWLCNEALVIDGDWQVMLVTHSSPLSTEVPYNTGPNWNCTHLIAALQCFKDGANYSVTSGTGEYAIDVHHDFSNQGARTIIGVFSGHNHVDSIIEKNGITYVSSICGYIDIQLYLGDGSLTENLGLREQHKYSAIAFDVAIVNTEEKQVKLKRFGFGEDREFTY